MTFEFFNIYTTSLIFFIFLFFTFKNIKVNSLIDKSEQFSSSRIYFFDFIKGISIIGVVLIHIAYFYYDFSEYGNFALYQDYIIKIFRYAVPFFIISSGFLLSLKNFSKENLFNFYKSKLIRLIIPYFIFCLVIFLLKNNNFNILSFLKEFISGGISTPYYFMSILFQLYIIYPLIIFLFNKFDKLKILIFSFLFSFFSSLFLYKFDNFVIFAPYLIYFTFGIYLKYAVLNTEIIKIIQSKKFINFNIFIIVLYLLFDLFGLKDHYSNFQFAYSIALFLVIFSFKDKIENKFKLLNYLGKNSLYIFLSHFFIMELIFNLLKNKFNLSVEFILFTFSSIVFGVFFPTLILMLFRKFLALKKI